MPVTPARFTRPRLVELDQLISSSQTSLLFDDLLVIGGDGVGRLLGSRLSKRWGHRESRFAMET